MLDVKRLIGEVAAQNGIRLEPNDPAFALVTLNQLVLEETAKRLFEQISAILAQFTDGLSKGEHLAGKTLAQEVRAAASEVRKEWIAASQEMKPESPTHVRDGHSRRYLWLTAGALVGMAMTTAGLAIYRLLGG